MEKNRCLILAVSISVFFYISACSGGKYKNLPDISGLKQDVQIIRFDQKIFALDTLQLAKGVIELEREYPVFFDIYFNKLLGFRYDEDSSFFYQNLEGFLKSDKIKDLYGEVDERFKNMADIEAGLSDAFGYMRYYFPSFYSPEIYTLFAEYTIQLFLFAEQNGKDAIGIGLDMFLGGDYPYGSMFPDNPSFSSYQTRSFNRDHIIRKTVEALIQDRLNEPKQQRLLDLMIQHGKILYALDMVLPMTHDSVIMEFSKEELDWCVQNELEMWAFFFKEELFYETDVNKINKYIYPSPHSPGMPDAAPGRTGNYMGWKIVEAFMQKFPDTSLDELFMMDDAQKLLELSKYKPKRI